MVLVPRIKANYDWMHGIPNIRIFFQVIWLFLSLWFQLIKVITYEIDIIRVLDTK